MRDGNDLALAVLTASAWDDAPVHGIPDDVLDEAWDLAVLNEVGADLVSHYPDRFDDRPAVGPRRVEFQARLREAAELLRSADIPAVLIKSRPHDGDPYSNFDLVVGPRRIADAVAVLGTWTARAETHPLEPDKVLLHPDRGPAAHLHQHVGWFGVPIVPGSALIARAGQDGSGPWLQPDPADDLRTYLAHAAYQNLQVPLRELRAIRGHLRHSETMHAAARRAQEEGWGGTFAHLTALLLSTCRDLDRGRPVRLPVPLPTRLAFSAGWEHAGWLARSGRPRLAARELALRGPLVAAKARRRWQRR